MTIWEIRLLWIWILNVRLPLICRGLNTVLFCLQSIPTCKLSQKIMATLLPSQTNCQKFIFFIRLSFMCMCECISFIYTKSARLLLAIVRLRGLFLFLVSRVLIYIYVCVSFCLLSISSNTHLLSLFLTYTYYMAAKTSSICRVVLWLIFIVFFPLHILIMVTLFPPPKQLLPYNRHISI